MVSHGYNASTQENEQEDSYEFKASLDYKVNSRTALDTMSPDLKKKKTTKSKNFVSGSNRKVLP